MRIEGLPFLDRFDAVEHAKIEFWGSIRFGLVRDQGQWLVLNLDF